MKNFTLEQYSLRGNVYELAEVYAGGEPVRSERLDCVSFTMNDLTRDLPPEWAERLQGRPLSGRARCAGSRAAFLVSD
ncbi:hypothetical protein [Paenibacillus antri]|uniref:hypothetical protein n=1 Tax=Paenibacillus antri TaxID=2582848 RepID=UPI00192E6F40